MNKKELVTFAIALLKGAEPKHEVISIEEYTCDETLVYYEMVRGTDDSEFEKFGFVRTTKSYENAKFVRKVLSVSDLYDFEEVYNYLKLYVRIVNTFSGK